MAATLIAVVAGIPAGLWLAGRAERMAANARAIEAREEECRRLAEEKARTRNALGQLEPVIRAHAAWFGVLGAWGTLWEYHDGPLGELWLVLRPQISAPQLTDRSLFGGFAIHFERCTRLDAGSAARIGDRFDHAA